VANIVIISASVRNGRNSHRVAIYLKRFIEELKNPSVEILDLKEYDFPVFEERLKFLNPIPAGANEFSNKLKSARGVIIVTPEYNGGIPAALKNVIDLLYDEWKRKPVAIATVSNGAFGGSQVITSLQFSLWKIGAWTVPAMFPVPNVEKTFDEAGLPLEKENTDKRATKFIAELQWCMEAASKMEKPL